MLARCGLLLVPVLALASGHRNPARPITLTVRPAVCLPPCDVEVRVRVERHPDNRWLMLTYESAHGQAGRTDRQIDGDATPPTQPPLRLTLSEGVYEIVAVLVGVRGVRGQASATCRVGSPAEDAPW